MTEPEGKEDTMITGTLKTNPKSDIATLSIATMLFEIDNLRVEPNVHKQADNHPDHIISCRTPRGNWMRVGSMWKSVSEITDNAYYAISVTDRNGKNWRMNAVRNAESPADEWTIVPLAGGNTDRIMVGGTLEETDDGNMVALIESYDFSMNVILVAVDDKREDSHPDFQIEATSPAGTTIRMGSAWKQVSERGNDYFSLSYYAPGGTQHRANAVKGESAANGVFTIIPLTEQSVVSAA
jgi:uncharacterized protein (DUF736 family)